MPGPWRIFRVIQHIGFSHFHNKTVYLCFHPLPVPIAARITKYLNKYVHRGICFINIYSKSVYTPLDWSKWYKTLVLHYLLQPRGVYTVFLYRFIKQRYVQTFWGIIHVCQAILETGSGRKLSHNGCTAANWLFGMPWGPEGSENIGKPSYFNLPPDIGFISFTPIKGRINRLTVINMCVGVSA
jgi:hypothetical protein